MNDRAATAGDRIAIIGAGHVGATAAYALMLRALVQEIILVDADSALAAAEAEDIADAVVMARPSRIWAGSYADAATAGIAVITAGSATHGAQSRLSVAAESAAIVRQCVSELVACGFAGVILVAANPVDLMALIAWRTSGFSASRVIGTGTLLDSSRLRHALAHRLGVAPNIVDAIIIGEHGDSSVAAFSASRIGGLSIARFLGRDAAFDDDRIVAEVREAGYRIIAGKGYTSFGVATAIVRICEAIIRDEQAVLPVSTLLSGQLGVSDICLSLPCIVGAGGIERILVPDLTGQEIAGFQSSARAVAAARAALGPDAGPETT